MSMYVKPERIYSKLNLIREEFGKLHSTGFEKLLYLLHGKHVRVNIEIPKHLYFRAEILVEDIQDEADVNFTQGDLINLLYDDFLRVVKKSANVSDFYQRLFVRKKDHPKIQDVNGGITTEWGTPTLATIPLYLPRKAALRGEVFLADLDHFYPDHPFQLEDVLEIIYTDFLIEFKRGALSNVIEKILKRIETE